MSIYDQAAPEKVVLQCPRCYVDHGPQIFNLTKADEESLIHEYACGRCGLSTELTHEFASYLPRLP